MMAGYRKARWSSEDPSLEQPSMISLACFTPMSQTQASALEQTEADYVVDNNLNQTKQVKIKRDTKLFKSWAHRQPYNLISTLKAMSAEFLMLSNMKLKEDNGDPVRSSKRSKNQSYHGYAT